MEYAQSTPPAGAATARQYLTFSMGSVLFALRIAVIKEILRNVQVTRVPLMPPHLRGVINLRGDVLPVIDLAVLFGWPPARLAKQTSVIVLEVHNDGDNVGEAMDIGILVDAVSAVIDIEAERIEAAPGFGTAVRPDFIEGLGKLAERVVNILSVERTFALSQIAPEAALDAR